MNFHILFIKKIIIIYIFYQCNYSYNIAKKKKKTFRLPNLK
ncbi:hypothetical protein PFNF54_02314, partial [Plasmodium falciparum NF54]